jgi:DNA-binding MarR family transcriptional regulator
MDIPADEHPTPLTATEEKFFRALGRAIVTLPRALDLDLLRDQRMSMSEYFALMHLSEAPDRRLRMSDLAAAAALSLSGMTRIVQRLEATGLVQRERCIDDRRGWLAILTDAGLERLRQAWPSHLASVRRRIFDQLDDVDLPSLAAAMQRIADGNSSATTLPDCNPDTSVSNQAPEHLSAQ